MGFLDAFDNPDIMSAILGVPPTMIPGNSAAPPPPPVASAPPVTSVPLPPPRPAMSNQGTPGLNAFDAVTPLPRPRPPLDQPPIDLSAPAPSAAPVARPSGDLNVPVGPRPGSLDNLALGMPTNAPLSLSPPPAAGPDTTGPQVYNGSAPPNFLTRAFGLDAQQQDRLRAALMGLGKGLSAVGQLRPGAPAGQAFAAGMGGALQGSAALEEEQKQNLFKNVSAAWNDLLAAEKIGDAHTVNQARANYIDAITRSIQLGGGRFGKSAWQDGPFGRVFNAENLVNKYENSQRILLQNRWRLNGATQEQQQQDLDALRRQVDEYRQNLYKRFGIDPSMAAKTLNAGKDPNNPIETKGMTERDFNVVVPLGAYYRDENGIVRRRTVGPTSQTSAASNAATAAMMSPMNMYLAEQPAE